MILNSQNFNWLIFKFLTISLLYVLVLLPCHNADASELKLSWGPPEGTNPDHIGGYYIYWGNESRNYVKQVHIGKVYETTINEVVEGNTYYCAVTSYYIGAPDIESDYSNEVVATIGAVISDPVAVSSTSTTPTTDTVSTTTQIATTDTSATVVPESAEQTFANQSPIADAGPDQTGVAGTIVFLDGTSTSDPDGDALSYAWTQLGTPKVKLTDAKSSQPSFTLPANAVEGQKYTFKLAVRDPEGLESTDTCSVTVYEPTGVEVIDLSGTWGKISKKRQDGIIVLFSSLKLSNLGKSTVDKVTVEFYQSADNNFDGSDHKVIEHEIFNLKAGTTVDVGLRIENFAVIGSEDRLIAVIDPDYAIEETNEENNISISSVIK